MKFTDSEACKKLGKDYTLLSLETGNFYFYKNLVIVEITKGVNFTFESSRELIEFTIKFYDWKPFGYISNRVNSYSSSPEDYPKVNNYITNIVSFAVVTYTMTSKNFTILEKKFCRKPFQNFSNLSDAVKWTMEQLESKASKAR